MDALVAAVLARQGFEVLSYQRISPFDSAFTERHTYRVVLTDGRTLKVRRTLGDARAQRVCEILAALSDDRFARVLCRDGPVLIEEWIDGVPPSGPEPAREHLGAAAGLLAKLHGVRAIGSVAVQGEEATEPCRVETATALACLAASGALRAPEAATLEAGLRRFDPRRAPTGLVHRDFCLENMVIDRHGVLRVIDNEALDVGAYDLDLARAWYRSAMTAAAWRRFEQEYHRLGGPAGRTGSPLFWRIAAVANGAIVRIERDPTRAEVPLGRLRELAAHLRAIGGK